MLKDGRELRCYKYNTIRNTFLVTLSRLFLEFFDVDSLHWTLLDLYYESMRTPFFFFFRTQPFSKYCAIFHSAITNTKQTLKEAPLPLLFHDTFVFRRDKNHFIIWWIDGDSNQYRNWLSGWTLNKLMDCSRHCEWNCTCDIDRCSSIVWTLC